VAQIVGERVSKGDAIVDYEEKVFDDIQAEQGEKAYIFMHTVPFEGSVGLVNMLTATRIRRKGFDTSIVLFGPGSLMASATRGYPKVGSSPSTMIRPWRSTSPGPPGATSSTKRPRRLSNARCTPSSPKDRTPTAAGRVRVS